MSPSERRASLLTMTKLLMIADMEEGAKLFAANCAACHQASGEGIPGVFPPLKGDGVVQTPDPAQQSRVLLQGIQGATIAGTVYSSPMPPFGERHCFKSIGPDCGLNGSRRDNARNSSTNSVEEQVVTISADQLMQSCFAPGVQHGR